MNLFNNPLKLFTLLITSVIFAGSALAGGGCGGSKSKSEKVAKFKTPQMIVFVNSTIDYLNNKEDSNQRHLKVLKNCQKTFDSSKNSVKGMEAKNLKTCKNLMSRGEYTVQEIARKLPKDQINNNNSIPLISKEVTENKIKNNNSNNSNTENNSDLMLF